MKIGIIGGTGFYKILGFETIERIHIDTPFGKPSSQIIETKIGGNTIYFLSRHGENHTILPSELNHRANIMAFKILGVERVVSLSAVGSLQMDIKPCDIVLPDQYFDRRVNSSADTFFGDGIVAHVSFGEPCCSDMRRKIASALKYELPEGVELHEGGVYVNISGPVFSTRVESKFYRSQGFSVIGMTSLAEARLCREAEICYQPIAMVTDYDSWRETAEPVDVKIIMENLKKNSDFAMKVLGKVISAISSGRECRCASALSDAIVTDLNLVSEEIKRKLGPIIMRFLKD